MGHKDSIISELVEYVTSVLEENREEFSGFAVCPFVRADRVADQLHLDVFDNKKETLVDVVLRFARSEKRSALIAQVNVDVKSDETRGYQDFINLVIEEAKVGSIKALCFNPNDKLEIEGYNPRARAPYFLINMAYTDDLSKAHRSLKKTEYYDKMPTGYKNYLGVKL